MAEQGGYYEKRPRPQHREYLEKYLAGRPIVSGVEFVDDFRMIVRRESMSDIYIYLTNQYELGVADIFEILSEAAETTCIVSTMDYNHYSTEAKDAAAEAGVGLFKATELLGAVYYDGRRFLEYLSPEQRRKRDKRSGS